ncbi:MAG: methylmalonyl-CoA epimerase [candidate division Zixibacteria bacterium]|nr:methylmalonyl-CoA epimerase [candidate division Zixibacteria bacterium]
MPRWGKLKIKKISHIGIAVSDLDGILKLFKVKLGLEHTHRETLPEHGVELAVVPIGESALEFIRPLEGNVSIQKFLEKRGPGMHHISLEVDNAAEWIEHIESDGDEMIDRKPRIGAAGCPIAFVHPKTLGGVLIELEEGDKSD